MMARIKKKFSLEIGSSVEGVTEDDLTKRALELENIGNGMSKMRVHIFEETECDAPSQEPQDVLTGKPIHKCQCCGNPHEEWQCPQEPPNSNGRIK